jgi:hypothetical protein
VGLVLLLVPGARLLVLVAGRVVFWGVLEIFLVLLLLLLRLFRLVPGPR